MPDGSGVAPYIVMEYVHGETLRDVLRSGRRLLPERALEIAEGLLVPIILDHPTVALDGIFAAYPSERRPPAKIRAFIDYLVTRYGPVPHWDRGLSS